MKTDRKTLGIHKYELNFLLKKASPLRHLDLSSSPLNRNILPSNITNRRIHSDNKLKLGLTIKIPKLHNFCNNNSSIKLKHINKNINADIIDNIIADSKDDLIHYDSYKTKTRNKTKSSFDTSKHHMTTTNAKYLLTNPRDKPNDDRKVISKLIIANINPSKRHEIDNMVNKGRLKRYSILDKLLFQVTRPEGAIEDYYRNNDTKPGDKYALFKRQLIRERNRLTDIINDIKKTQSMNESMLKVFMSKLTYSKIKAMTYNFNKGH